MKMIYWLLSLCLLPCGFAQQAPWARPDIPISSHDRVYTADQTSIRFRREIDHLQVCLFSLLIWNLADSQPSRFGPAE